MLCPRFDNVFSLIERGMTNKAVVTEQSMTKCIIDT
jgi:hypothetical protein